MDVSAERLRYDIESNATFGSNPTVDGRGRTVLTGTDADRRAREFLCKRLRDADLDVRIDPVGNVVGRWTPASADPASPPVTTGSHLDSVPDGGIFDGPLGVYAGLEAIRSMQDAGFEPSCPIEVVSFTEEEGQRFGGGLIGSMVAAGAMTIEDALAIEDDAGQSLGNALTDIGFRGDGHVDAREWDAWIELHVEQSSRLVEADATVGVVTTIVGLSRCVVEIVGQADHAGTTTMAERSDALVAAAEFVTAIERAAAQHGSPDDLVATVGKLEVTPNAPNVIPGKVTLTIDIRAEDDDQIESIIDRARQSLDQIQSERPVDTRLDHAWERPPVTMSSRCRTALHDAADDVGLAAIDLHSGAGHDTMHVADVTDAAMLFAPSRGGASHNPSEWTDWTDCAAASQVLAVALADLTSQ